MTAPHCRQYSGTCVRAKENSSRARPAVAMGRLTRTTYQSDGLSSKTMTSPGMRTVGAMMRGAGRTSWTPPPAEPDIGCSDAA